MLHTRVFITYCVQTEVKYIFVFTVYVIPTRLPERTRRDFDLGTEILHHKVGNNESIEFGLLISLLDCLVLPRNFWITVIFSICVY